MNIMVSLLYATALSWLALCVGALSAQSRIFMTVKAGSSVLLPCNWTAVSSNRSSSELSPHVEWRTSSEVVFERYGENQYQGKGYEGRVDLPEDKLVSGDCSLELKNVTHEDAGVYESYLLVTLRKRSLRSKRVFIQSVELSVDERITVADGAGMNCPHLLISASCLFIYYLFQLLL